MDSVSSPSWRQKNWGPVCCRLALVKDLMAVKKPVQAKIYRNFTQWWFIRLDCRLYCSQLPSGTAVSNFSVGKTSELDTGVQNTTKEDKLRRNSLEKFRCQAVRHTQVVQLLCTTFRQLDQQRGLLLGVFIQRSVGLLTDRCVAALLF